MLWQDSFDKMRFLREFAVNYRRVAQIHNAQFGFALKTFGHSNTRLAAAKMALCGEQMVERWFGLICRIRRLRKIVLTVAAAYNLCVLASGQVNSGRCREFGRMFQNGIQHA